MKTQRIVTTVVVMLILSTVAKSASVRVQTDALSKVGALQKGGPERILFDYEFDKFTRRAVNIKGHEYTKIILNGESSKKMVGAPELPDVSRSVIIPDDAEIYDFINVYDPPEDEDEIAAVKELMDKWVYNR